jgi:hypothetical protein
MQKDPNPLGMNAERLAAACDAIEALADETQGPSHVCLTRAGDQNIVIRGDTAGLVELAHYLLMVATSRTEGWHVHLDQNTLFAESESDFNLIVGYEIEQGSWEKRSD